MPKLSQWNVENLVLQVAFPTYWQRDNGVIWPLLCIIDMIESFQIWFKWTPEEGEEILYLYELKYSYSIPNSGHFVPSPQKLPKMFM